MHKHYKSTIWSSCPSLNLCILINFESLTGLLKTLASKSPLDILLKVLLSQVEVYEYKVLPADLKINFYQLKKKKLSRLG